MIFSDMKIGNDVRGQMIDYIKEHFSDVLGEHIDLLDQDDGLDELAAMMRDGKFGVKF